MQRRSFLKGMAGVILGAPAIVSASSLMKIIVPNQNLVVPGLQGIQNGDDWLKRLGMDFDGDIDRDYFNVWTPGGKLVGGFIVVDENGNPYPAKPSQVKPLNSSFIMKARHETI